MGRIRLSLFLLAGLMALLSGCGERQTGANRPGLIILGDRMTVYSGAPLSGYLQDQGEALVNGERLALRDSHGMAGEWTIALGSLNSVQGAMNLPSEGQVASNARIAIQDATAVAYIGDYGSDSTQISLPLTNQGGILQVSTESGYSGLTSSRYAQPGEPERFYPSGRRTFARLAPNDQREASAQARLQRSRGCGETFAIVAPGSVGNSIRLELAAALATEKVGSGGTAVYDGSPAALREASSRAKASGADCVYYGAAGDATGAALLNRLIAADRSVKLFAGRASSTLQMTENLSASAQDALLVTTPAPSSSDLTAFGKSVARRYRAVFGSEPGVSGLYGYEAMAAVLDSIRRAGVNGNNRDSVIASFRAIRNRSSVLGRYSITSSGDSTLSAFTVSQVRGGRLVASSSLTAAANGK